MLFWKREKTKDVEFYRVNSDIQSLNEQMQVITQWIQYFDGSIRDINSRMYRLQTHLSYIPKTKEQIKQVIDSPDKSEIDQIREHIKELKQHVDHLKNQPKEEKIVERIIEKPVYSENLMERVGKPNQKIADLALKHSKDHLMKFIVQLMQKYGDITAQKLKEIVVEEQGLCSKSTFYRLLEELERQYNLKSERKGKVKYYFSPKLDKHI